MMLDDIELPPSVPALKPEDFIAGRLHDRKRACLLGWRFHLFMPCRADLLASDAMRAELDARGWHKSPYQFNDERPAEEACEVWAGMLGRLGYVQMDDRFVLPAQTAQEAHR